MSLIFTVDPSESSASRKFGLGTFLRLRQKYCGNSVSNSGRPKSPADSFIRDNLKNKALFVNAGLPGPAKQIRSILKTNSARFLGLLSKSAKKIGHHNISILNFFRSITK